MLEHDFRIARLVAHYLSGELTPEETEELETWRKESEAHEALFAELCIEDNLGKYAADAARFDVHAGWKGTDTRIRKIMLRLRYRRLMAWAAVFLVPILIIGAALLPHRSDSASQGMTLKETMVLSGSTKATLTLGNGETISLDGSKMVAEAGLDGISVKSDSSSLNYVKSAAASSSYNLIYNKVETPHGGEYRITLGDGTRVHLNALSALRYPVEFAADKREVELSGEAYFEVTKDARPFLVKTEKGVGVEVLGTTFNLSAYPGEICQTTLLDGSVKVSNGLGENRLLKPSQQASILPDGKEISVRTVDVAFYSSWVKGKILFKDCTLEDMMKVLGRWYDVEATYESEAVRKKRFGCHVNRYANISLFIEQLKRTGGIDARMEGNKIYFYN